MAIEASPTSSPDPGGNANPGAERSGVHVQRGALVGYTPERMYALVADVERYPQWFDWCAGARVLHRDGPLLRAELQIRMVGVSARFSTENQEFAPERMRMRLIDGPFRSLDGEWTFAAVGETGCRVALDLHFEVSSGLLAGALTMGFKRVADRMVDDFCRAARREYGRG